MNYLEIYKQCIDFHRKYTDVRDSPEYWESVVSESDAIVKQVTESEPTAKPFIIGILKEVILELERKAKRRGGKV